MAAALAPLWGDEAASAPTSTTTPYVILPSSDDPRLILPARPHRAAATILRSLRDASSFRARAQNAALRALLLTRVRADELPDPSLLGAVCTLLPSGDPGEYVCGAHLGPARANRKPVLAVTSRDGVLVAFAKWGVGDLTDTLVRREAGALGRLGDLKHLDAPHLLGMIEHEGHPAVVQSPVPRSRRTPSPAAVIRAQVEVASIATDTVDAGVALEASTARWRERVSASPGAVVEEFAELARRWADDAAAAELHWGSWHGDWRRTNMDAGPAGCSVWDWERFDTGVPAGYDALHLFLTDRAPVTPLGALPAAVHEQAPRLLQPFGQSTQAASLVATGYLLELAGRYLDDQQSAAGARLGAVDEWLLPHLRTNSTTTRGTTS
jgi:hypothetical protein